MTDPQQGKIITSQTQCVSVLGWRESLKARVTKKISVNTMRGTTDGTAAGDQFPFQPCI